MLNALVTNQNVPDEQSNSTFQMKYPLNSQFKVIKIYRFCSKDAGNKPASPV